MKLQDVEKLVNCVALLEEKEESFAELCRRFDKINYGLDGEGGGEGCRWGLIFFSSPACAMSCLCGFVRLINCHY